MKKILEVLQYGEFDFRFNTDIDVSRRPEIISAMRDDDILIMCSDHGNDPVHAGFNHTREYIPFVAYGKRIKEGYDLGTRSTYGDIGQTICDILGAAPTAIGTSFKNEILK